MSQRPTHLTILVYDIVFAFFGTLPRLHARAGCTDLAQRLRDILAELLCLAAQLNWTILRRAAFGRPRLPRAPACREPACTSPAPTRTAPAPRTPRAPRTPGTPTSHQLVQRIAALLDELDAVTRQLGPLISPDLHALGPRARAETARRLHPIRYVSATKPRGHPPRPRPRLDL